MECYALGLHWVPHGLNGSAVWPQICCSWLQTQAGYARRVFSSPTSSHCFWKPFGPFSVPSAQKTATLNFLIYCRIVPKYLRCKCLNVAQVKSVTVCEVVENLIATHNNMSAGFEFHLFMHFNFYHCCSNQRTVSSAIIPHCTCDKIVWYLPSQSDVGIFASTLV